MADCLAGSQPGIDRPETDPRAHARIHFLFHHQHSIEQDIVGDCSFIASLIICAAYERRHRKQLVSKILFPQDAQGQPVYNAKGKVSSGLGL